MRRTYRLKLAVISLTLAAVACVIFTGNAANPSARAFSQGPPAGHTSAPGEFNCSECHVTSEPGTGKLIVEAPTHYAPGQTYQLKVRQTNTDLTRLRWGFQLTALDSDNQKAGLLASTDSFTQVLDNQGPFPNRQYVEHTEAGTFEGQQGGATWTFNWTAPASDVGPVAFYAAGNQANGDRNTSGDHVYFTFVVSVPGEPAPDFAVSISPASRTVTPGGVAVYNVTVAPSGGFNGQVTLSAANQPAGASAVFDPPTLNFNDSSAQTSTLTVTTGAGTPAGNHQFTVNATGGSLARSANATLRVVSAASADLSVAKTASPNPVALGGVITYRITVVNHGPAQATGVALTDPLPLPLVPGSVTTTQGSCSGTTTVNCQLGTLAAGASAVVQINVNAQTAGLSSNVADVRADQSDFDASNNSATAAVNVEESSSGPRMTVPDLGVRTVVTGLDQPTTMAFIGPNEFLILEKASGRVRRVREGALLPDALDLAVNNASERGLLGIALHSNFTSNRFVYLYWTWRGAGDGANQLLGADTGDVSAVPLLGNRVDRFTWDGSKLTFDRNIISLRALQTDAGQPARGNHNGGVLRFEAGDQKLYVLVGDVGRRGLLQNVTTGLGPGGADDEFGGPEPDDAHLTGVVLRLNDDGTTPADNPFFNAPTTLTGQAAANVKKIFAYGVRNSFGMDFDPAGGKLWLQENGDDAFDELNRVEPGSNNGWIQLMGPAARLAQYRDIEVSRGNSLQQNRWPPTLIAPTPAEAMARLYQLPGSQYRDPEFSWKYAVAPSPVGFLSGPGLGAAYTDRLFVGASRTTLLGGYLFKFDLTSDRLHVATSDARLADRVADNADKFDLAESESLLVGRDFGITTDIRTGPDGHLYVVSLSDGAVYEVFPLSVIRFVSETFTVGEGARRAVITVTREGDASAAATVEYATQNELARARGDYTAALGTLRFAPGERTKTFDVLITDDAFVEGTESVALYLSEPKGAGLHATFGYATLVIQDNDATAPAANPIDDAEFFVRQHYADFLNREPDAAGLQFWTGQITLCGSNAACVDQRRTVVSAEFFRSIEFQETGFFAHRLYETSFDRPPRLDEFLRDTQELGRGVVVGQPGWEARLEANRQAFVARWLERPDFKSAYDSLTDAQYVDKLVANAGLMPAQANRDALVAGLTSGTETRASVLRKVADSEQLKRNEFNRAFVLMQYFGYLRREPDEAGYTFWLQKLNNHNGDFQSAEMVRSFLVSGEYRGRFGP